MKKIISLLICFALLLTVFAGCGRKKNETGSVYYLNFKPEQDAAWQALAAKYTEETGVPVKVVTASQGTYEQTLTAEIDKSTPPTLFQISGEIGLNSWQDYCLDLSDSEVYRQLTSDDFALKKDGKVYGVAYVYEGFGLIVNKDLLKKAGYTIDSLKSFEDIKKVAEDITKRKAELGFSAFTSAGLDSSSSWRYSGHLANIPLYYEFKADNVTAQPATIKGTHLDTYKNWWDLYTNNSTVDKSTLTAVTGDQAVSEFVTGKAVFYQNGTWAYEDVKAIGDDNLGFIPLYAGVDDANQGICAGTENYWAVNSKASDADKKATLDFLEWVVTSNTGTTALAESMEFISPFKMAKKVDNVLCNIMNDYVADGKKNIDWVFNYTPNVDVWRSDVTSALAAYSAGKGDWNAVKDAFVNGWEKQYKASQS